MFPEKIHIACVAGIGMSGLAILLKQKGHILTGSDKNLTPGQIWKDIKIISEDELPEDMQLLIISSAMNEKHPQILLAKEKKLPIMHRMEVIVKLFESIKVLGMLGSHGKTSSTGMLANILYDQTFLVGGVHQNRGANAQWIDSSEYAVFETDESDGSFNLIDIYGGLFTTLDREHLPHYDEDFDKLKLAFKQYLLRQKNKNLIMINADDLNLKQLLDEMKESGISVNEFFHTYGINEQADFRIINIREKLYDLILPDNTIIKNIELGVYGKHFLHNSAGVASLAYLLNMPMEQIKKGLKEYKGMERRLTKIGEIKGISFIDDYAHHPTEIKASLQALQEEYKRILVFFEPHRYTRMSDLWNEFVTVLSKCEKVYVLPFYGASEQAIEGITSEDFVKENEKFILSSDMLAEIKAFDLQKGDCVVCMGAGYSSKLIKSVFEESKNQI